MDVNKQIFYWRSGSDNDLETAEILIFNRKFVHGLFFCHLSVEKLLKALVAKRTLEIPPKSHVLSYLSELADVRLLENQKEFLAILMKYQLKADILNTTRLLQLLRAYPII